jgi:very-short-patch-repair endonuclease
VRSVSPLQVEEEVTSPLEKIIERELAPMLDVIEWSYETQVPAGRYTLDFVVTARGVRVAVECDGHTYHERTPEQATHDRKRDRWILRELGISTLRFTSKEIFGNAEACCSEIIRTVDRICDRQTIQTAEMAHEAMRAGRIAAYRVVGLVETKYDGNALMPVGCPVYPHDGISCESGGSCCGGYLGTKSIGEHVFALCGELTQ